MAYDGKRLSGLLYWARLPHSNFDMRVWVARERCGTVMCLAGKTILDAGYVVDDEAIDSGRPKVCTKHGQVWDIPHAARFELGLKEPEADLLFTPDLEEEAREAVEDYLLMDADKASDLATRMAMDFLCYLVVRSRHNRANMSGPEVQVWRQAWVLAHEDELSEAYLAE